MNQYGYQGRDQFVVFCCLFQPGGSSYQRNHVHACLVSPFKLGVCNILTFSHSLIHTPSFPSTKLNSPLHNHIKFQNDSSSSASHSFVCSFLIPFVFCSLLNSNITHTQRATSIRFSRNIRFHRSHTDTDTHVRTSYWRTNSFRKPFEEKEEKYEINNRHTCN